MCCKTFSVANMGIGESHSEEKKHQSAVKELKDQMVFHVPVVVSDNAV